jgi:hypothetical protein
MAAVVAGVGIAGLQVAQTLLRRPFLTTITKAKNAKEFITFDATERATHSGTAELTRHPVQRGVDFTDHVRRNPRELSLNVIVTDTPVLLLPALRATPAVAGGDINKRSKEAWDFLEALKDAGDVVNVSTKLKDYLNMVITDLSVSQDKDTSNIIAASIMLEEIRVGTTESQPLSDPVDPGRSEERDLGKKTTTPSGNASTVDSLISEALGIIGI